MDYTEHLAATSRRVVSNTTFSSPENRNSFDLVSNEWKNKKITTEKPVPIENNNMSSLNRLQKIIIAFSVIW